MNSMKLLTCAALAITICTAANGVAIIDVTMDTGRELGGKNQNGGIFKPGSPYTEMIHMSRFTGKQNPKRDQLIAATFHVWVVSLDGKSKRKAGRGDDPNWSPNGFVTRSFPDPKKGGANVMIESKIKRKKGGKNGWRELPIVPSKTTRYGRFTWKP